VTTRWFNKHCIERTNPDSRPALVRNRTRHVDRRRTIGPITVKVGKMRRSVRKPDYQPLTIVKSQEGCPSPRHERVVHAYSQLRRESVSGRTTRLQLLVTLLRTNQREFVCELGDGSYCSLCESEIPSNVDGWEVLDDIWLNEAIKIQSRYSQRSVMPPESRKRPTPKQYHHARAVHK
jgi:hypothetical protein